MGQKMDRAVRRGVIMAGSVLFGGFVYVVWGWVPRADIRLMLIGLCGGLCLLGLFWRMNCAGRWMI